MKTKILLLGIFFFIAAQIMSQPYQWWTSSYSSATGSENNSSGITSDHDGNAYVTGWSDGFGTGGDIILVKIHAYTGDTVWVRRFTGPGANEDRALDITSDLDFIYITGFSLQPSRDIVTLKYDHAGNLIWASTYNGTNNGGDYGFAVDVDEFGNVYVAGRSDDGAQHYTTIKYNSAGTQEWARVYSGPLSQTFDQAQCIAVDSGNVYVSGFTCVGQDFHTADYLTVKYNGQGVLQWAKRYNGTGNDEDVATGMAVRKGHLFVTGRTDSSNGNYNFYTVMYDKKTGDSLDGAFFVGDNLRQIDNSVDMSADAGDIYITGYSWGPSNSYDFITIKYNSDLKQQWMAKYEGVGHDMACKLVASTQGVYVTGTSQGENGWDFLTVKYSPLNGEQMWEMRFNGPANGDDHCSAIAADKYDNVYVTGYSTVMPGGVNIFSVRYSPEASLVRPVSGKTPQNFDLHQNYPNPFNPSTNISFDIPAATLHNTQLIIYDVLGRQVEMIVNQQLQPGRYSVSWNASKYSSGIYFYKIVSGDYVKTNRMILVK